MDVRGTLRLYARALVRRSSPPVRFVLFGLGRTGSTLLSELLNAHPRVRSDGEILHDPVRWPKMHVWGHVRGAGGCHAYGFKLLSYQLRDRVATDPSTLLTWLSLDGFHIVHLHRRNAVRHALSNIFARRRDFHVRRGDRTGVPQPIHVSPEELDRYLERYELGVALVERTLGDLPRIPIVYEDDLATVPQQSATTDRLFELFGVVPADVISDLVRTTPRDSRDLLTNFDEIHAHLRGTSYAGQLLAGTVPETGS